MNGHSLSGQRGPRKDPYVQWSERYGRAVSKLSVPLFPASPGILHCRRNRKTFLISTLSSVPNTGVRGNPGPVVMELLQKPTECYCRGFPNSNQRQDLEFLFF